MINIRAANLNEVSLLQNLNDKIFTDNPSYDPDLDLNWAHSDKGKQYFTDLLNNPDTCCLIAEEDGRFLGYIAAGSKHISYRKSKYMEIENMGVIPEYRSQGVGKLLMTECAKWGKSRGFQKVLVNAYFNNKIAVHFYKKIGFQEIDVTLEKSL